MKDCKAHYTNMVHARMGEAECPFCEIEALKVEVIQYHNTALAQAREIECRAEVIAAVTAEVERHKESKASIGKELDKWRGRAIAHQATNQRLRDALQVFADLGDEFAQQALKGEGK